MNARLFLVSISLLAVLAISSCSGGSTSPVNVDPADSGRINQWVFGDATVVPVIAGKHYTAGEVTVTNDYNTIYFSLELFDDWVTSEVHIDVADDYSGFPQNKKGILIPGHFEFAMDFDPAVNAYVFELPLGDYEAGDTFAFAFHLVVTSEVYGEQTGWAGCYEFDGPRWGYWCEHETGFCEIELPDCAEDYQAKYYYPGSLGYWDVEFFNMPEGYDLYNGIWPGWCIQKYVYAYPNTFYDICAISSYDEENLPPAIQGINWEAVAWILNHKQGNVMSVQYAIWHFTDGFVTNDPDALAMIQDAEDNSEGYYPGPGESMAVVLFVNNNVQAIFAEVTIGCPE